MDFITNIYNVIVKFILDLLAICNINTENVPEWLKPITDAE